MPTSIERVAQQLEALRVRVDRGFRSPQLPNASLDNASFVAKDANGGLMSIFGLQFDGTFGAVSVGGPTPPIPSGVTGETAVSGLNVTWNGTFLDPQAGFTSPVVAPMTFNGVLVEVSESADFTGTVSKGVIPTAAGGDRFIAWRAGGVTVNVRLRARDQNGKLSPPSEVIQVTTGQVQLGDLGFDVRNYVGANTIYYTESGYPAAPPGGFRAGDLLLRRTGVSPGGAGMPEIGTPLFVTERWTGALWDPLENQGVSSALATAIAAQNEAESKAQWFTQSTAPEWTGIANSAFWIDTSSAAGNVTKSWNGTDWATRALGSGAIQPNSLVAANVIATGTITGSLFEAEMVLANTLIAGDPLGDHSALDSSGLHIYQLIAQEGLTEVGRMGTDSNDFFSLTNNLGVTVINIDDTGVMSATGVNTQALSVKGVDFFSVVNALSEGVVGRFSQLLPGDITGIFERYGIAEVGCVLQKGRAYAIDWRALWRADIVGSGDEVRFTLVGTNGVDGNVTTQPAAPTTSLGAYSVWERTASVHGRWFAELGTYVLIPTITSRFRLLLCIERGAGTLDGTVSLIRGNAPVQLTVTDLGPAGVQGGQITSGGGVLRAGGTGGSAAPGSVSQGYDTGDMGDNAHYTYRGDGSQRADTTDIVHGNDPARVQGDQRGHWRYAIPNISGTITRAQLAIYCKHTYYNTGGSAKFNLSTQVGVANPAKLVGEIEVGGFPKPGWRVFDLPAAWLATFRLKTAISVTVGPSASTNLLYYCRFDHSNLRLWYTQ